MSEWLIRGNKSSVRSSAANWLTAVGEALGPLGLDEGALTRMICDVRPNGTVRIADPSTGVKLLVRRLDLEEASAAAPPAPAPAPPAGVMETLDPEEIEAEEPEGVADPSEAAEESAAAAPAVEAPPVEAEVVAAPAAAPPVAALPVAAPPVALPPVAEAPPVPAASVAEAPAVAAPEEAEAADNESFGFVASAEAPGIGGVDFVTEEFAFFDSTSDGAAPDDLAEALFLRGDAIANAEDVKTAAEAAMTILRDVTQAESAAVLYASLNDTALRFIAAQGPRSKKLTGARLPFGEGIAGWCHDRGMAVIIRNAGDDPRHHSRTDEATGYATQSVLATVLRDSDGTIHGVLELLNHPDRFQDWHLDAADSVAQTLGDVLRHRRP